MPSLLRIGLSVLLLLILGVSDATAQRGPGRGGLRGPGRGGPGGQGNAEFVADRDLFHYLLDHRAQIRRDVKKVEGGVETLTESDEPEVASKIQEHVASMEKRVAEKRPIHLRDPLFAEIFAHADKIKFTHEVTPNGVRVWETSDDPYVARLIQSHADVVSNFLKNGYSEVHKNHPLPPKK